MLEKLFTSQQLRKIQKPTLQQLSINTEI